MKTIYKYPIELMEKQELCLPIIRKIINVQVQDDKMCIWAEVETESPVQSVTIIIVGTGQVVPQNARTHIGTVHLDGFVWHIYTE